MVKNQDLNLKLVNECLESQSGLDLIADNPQAKAQALIKKGGQERAFPFEFNNCLYWCEAKTKKDEQVLKIDKIADFIFKALTFSKKDSGDSIYSLKITYYNGEELTADFASREMLSTRAFNSKIRRIKPCGYFYGSARQLNAYCEQAFKEIKEIKTKVNIG